MMVASRLQWIVVLAAAMVSLSGCGGDEKRTMSAAPQQSTLWANATSKKAIEPRAVVKPQKFGPADPAWKISSVASASVELETLEPAEVYTFSLQESGIDTTASVTAASDSVADAIIKDGTLRFSTPGDTGADQAATFTVHGLNGNTTIKALIRSTRPSKAVADSDAREDGSPPAHAPFLSVTGLGPHNSFSGRSVKFKLEGVSALDLKNDSNGVVQGADKVKISLKNYWVFDHDDTSFSISASAMQQLLAALPTGALTVMLSFVSKDGTFAQSYDLMATKSVSRLTGKLMNSQGAGVTGMAGKKILLKGYTFGMRLAALVDNAGHFEFPGVIPDTYQLTVNDLNEPNVVTVSTVVRPDSTQVNVTMVYDSPAIASDSR